jgi:beta-glucanase (GH16 family)
MFLSKILCLLFLALNGLPRLECKRMGGDFYEDWSKGIDPLVWTVGQWVEHGGQLSSDRIYIEDQVLVLVFQYDPDFYEKTGMFKSSAIQTLRDDFGYGRWEARLKVPQTDGILASMYTIDWRNSGGETRQEIDIEFVTANINDHFSEVHLAVHGRDFSSWETQVKLGFNPALDFHIWGFDITPERIQWFVDDIILYEYIYQENLGQINAPYTLKFNLWSAYKGKDDAGIWIQGPPQSQEKIKYFIDWVRFQPYE